MDTNFWTWVLSGVQTVMDGIAGLFPMHELVGIPTMAEQFMQGGPAAIIMFVGSFFNLAWFGTVCALIIILEIVRGLIAIYRWVVSLIQVP
jgi:hypothetical protein